jgi:hypothetical protein
MCVAHRLLHCVHSLLQTPSVQATFRKYDSSYCEQETHCQLCNNVTSNAHRYCCHGLLLTCTATHCLVLPPVALYCHPLPCTATCCLVLPPAALYCLLRWKCSRARCPGGYAETAAGTCRACPAGSADTKEGNGTFPEACELCPAGTYTTSPGKYACQSCFSPQFLINVYKMIANFVAATDNTTGKMAPKNGSTACDVPW